MKPPVCSYCLSKKSAGAQLIQFADYEPLPEVMIGHPHGLEWFCESHAAAAQALAHLPFAEALQRMRGASR